ncbi:MAG: GNAT family N-acetyltransferase [Pseudomonadota bacterium]
MHIRPITDDDIPAVAALMRGLSEEYIVHDCSVASAASFVRENDEAGLRSFIRAGMAYHVAEQDGQILGFIAVREYKHLLHMFVDKQHHRRGIASALWAVARQAAIDAGNPGEYTVNSSNYAVPVYKAMGFVQTEPTQCKNGIYFNPMRLDERHGD